MKNSFLLFCLTITILMSCKSDDDDSTKDPLVGTWTWSQTFVNDFEETLDVCNKQSLVTVDADGTYIKLVYFQDFEMACELIEELTGSWENNGSGNYTVTIDGNITEQEITFDDDSFTAVETYGSNRYKDVFLRQ